jgi:hypothetical protein
MTSPVTAMATLRSRPLEERSGGVGEHSREPPTASVSRADRHQAWSMKRAFMAPTTKNATPVITALHVNGCATSPGTATSYTNTARGRKPMVRNAVRVARAARYSFGSVEPNPSSSLIIVSAQSAGSEVITSTTRSSSSPPKPFAAKIWRISSRSPSGTSRM